MEAAKTPIVNSEERERMLKDVQNRRFYDQDPATANSIELIKTLPKELQFTLAKGLNTIAIRDFNVDTKLSQFRSLGKDIILPLYKSKQKLRFYDQNPDFHNAVNYLRILSEQERLSLSKKVTDITGYIQQYVDTCQQMRRTPSAVKAEQIQNAYVDGGSESAKQATDSICNDVAKSANPLTDISFDDNIIRSDTH